MNQWIPMGGSITSQMALCNPVTVKVINIIKKKSLMHVTESFAFLHPKYFFAIWLLPGSLKKKYKCNFWHLIYLEPSKKENTSNRLHILSLFFLQQKKPTEKSPSSHCNYSNGLMWTSDKRAQRDTSNNTKIPHSTIRYGRSSRIVFPWLVS